MSVKGNNTSGLISALVTDTTILQNTSTSDRWAVTSISLHEFGGTGDTVELFVSNDATSAAAERVDNIVLAANETEKAIFPTLVLAAGQFLLANALTGSLVNVEAIYTIYSGDS